MSMRINSEIVWNFTSAKHQMELNADVSKLKKMQSLIRKRKDKLIGDQTGAGQVKQKSFNKSIQAAQKFKLMQQHRMPIQQFCKAFNTDLKMGLSEQVAAKRLKQEGPNKLSQKPKTHPIVQYFLHMLNFFSILLWAGAVLCFIAYGVATDDPSNLYLGLVLVAVVLISTTVQFVQNRKSADLMESFKNFAPPQTIVIRDGHEKTISAQLIVRGDLIKIELGKRIPADIRITVSNGMKVDNSSLTGQTALQARSSQCTHPDNPLESKNVAFFSTLNKEGSGIGFVMLTGDRTFIGQIAGLAALSPDQKTPLQKQIDRFVFRLGLAAIGLGIIIFVVGIIIGFQIITALTLAIGITVANVPSGLLLQVTMALTLTAKVLFHKKVLAKSLQAVETLGSTTCICSDKTGTLTLNKMTAANLWFDGNICKASNRQKQGKNYKYEYDLDDPAFKALHQCAVICSVAIFDKSPPQTELNKIRDRDDLNQQERAAREQAYIKQWQIKLRTMSALEMLTIGDASQSALIKFFQPIQDIKQTRQRFKCLTNQQGSQLRLLFNSANKFAYSINSYKSQKHNSDICLFTKGAPQKVWKMCTHVLYRGQPVLKNEEWQKKFHDSNQFFGKNGQRVLGFAKLHLPKQKYTASYPYKVDDPAAANFPLFGQVFVGALSLNDPPRDAVPLSVTTCQAAGVKVIMVTGDQPVTAVAIARKCNIIRQVETVNEIAEREKLSLNQVFHRSKAIMIHGDQLTRMSLEDQGLPQKEQGKKLDKWLEKDQIVFARTSPAQKLIIVKACQRLGHIVAVTGDGVNDSPAIKKADLGISMGITGTDVAKDAADMVLINDDFSSIVVAMQQGRKIFDNLKKAICYVATSQISQIAPFIGLLIIQYPAPITTVVLLCIDLGTDLLPAISYAYQPSQIGIMTRKPRRPDQHLVSMKLMAQGYGWMGWTSFFCSLGAFYIVMNDFGFPGGLFYKNGINIIRPNPSDVYNPTDKYFGNTRLFEIKNCTSYKKETQLIDWLYSKFASVDLRLGALSCEDVKTENTTTPVYTQMFTFGECRIQQISPITNKPICYTTQAAKYGQSSYFYANVFTQVCNFFICKTRKQSGFTQGLSNPNGYFGLSFEIFLMFILAYVQPLNIVFGTRDNIYIHFGIIGLPYGMLMLTFDEIRKFLIRNLPSDEKGKPNWFYRNTLW